MASQEENLSSDRDAVNFWNKNFQKAREVSPSEFAKALLTTFDKYPADTIYKVVDHFVAKHGDLEPIRAITVKDFTSFLDKYGAFLKSIDVVVNNFFDRNGDVHCWYHFAMDREHAKRRMHQQDTFLVRDSGRKNSFVLVYSKSGVGLKELLFEARGGEFLINPPDDQAGQLKCPRASSVLSVIKGRADKLDATISTLYQAYVFAKEDKKEVEVPDFFESFVLPAKPDRSADYASHAKHKEEVKIAGEKHTGNYVVYQSDSRHDANAGNGAGAGTGAGATSPGGSAPNVNQYVSHTTSRSGVHRYVAYTRDGVPNRPADVVTLESSASSPTGAHSHSNSPASVGVGGGVVNSSAAGVPKGAGGGVLSPGAMLGMNLHSTAGSGMVPLSGSGRPSSGGMIGSNRYTPYPEMSSSPSPTSPILTSSNNYVTHHSGGGGSVIESTAGSTLSDRGSQMTVITGAPNYINYEGTLHGGSTGSPVIAGSKGSQYQHYKS